VASDPYVYQLILLDMDHTMALNGIDRDAPDFIWVDPDDKYKLCQKLAAKCKASVCSFILDVPARRHLLTISACLGTRGNVQIYWGLQVRRRIPAT
jgi:hypothetical protein